MQDLMVNNVKVALLIDAENVSSNYIKTIFDELSKYGVVTYKRLYGDWTNPNMGKWRKVIIDNALTPMQQFQNTTNKNSSDSALIIDAMDIMYSGTVESFCIVSSDGDYTRLITRLRENGNYVIGMGEMKAPVALKKVCDKYVYLDMVVEEEKEETTKKPSENKKGETKKQPSKKKTICLEKEKINATKRIVMELSDEEGFANFSEVYNRLIKLYSDMDPGNYGYRKASDLFENCNSFEMKKEQGKLSKTVKHIFIKIKE